MRKKKVFIIILTVAFCISAIPFSAGAVGGAEIHEVNSININELMDNSSDVSVSEPMTFEEMVARYAENDNITYYEAYELLGGNSRSVQPYSTNDLKYRVFSANLHVTDVYIPHIEFFCVTAEGGHFFQINSIYSVQLVRSYENMSKQFSGNIECWLRSGYDIEYVINGDFYNNGTTTVAGGGNVNVGLNEVASIGFNASITYSSNHYKYFYKHSTLHWGP